MIRAYVVDDEAPAVRRLVRMLTDSRRVDVMGSATDPAEAIEFLDTHPVDALFLDVQMPEVNGFELLQRLSRPVPVVFVTAFDRYAVEAFEVDSIDYLLKPIERERLERALDRLERLKEPERIDVAALAREIAGRLAPRRPIERIASRVGERTVMLDLPHVSHFVARDKSTFAVVNGREHAIEQTLGDLERLLDTRRFVRIHRATIVNAAAIAEIDKWIDGGVLVRLKDAGKTELPVAGGRGRARKELLGI
jgi:two-component system LytT family response regulator